VLPYEVPVLRYYLTASGESPFESWFSDLDAAAAAKVTVALARLGQGNTSNAKGVGEGVLEYRIDWGPGYRVYFGRDGETLVILLTGGTKQRQQRDIERAKELWADYKRRRKPPTR
jgi:putative addiction module killer protein